MGLLRDPQPVGVRGHGPRHGRGRCRPPARRTRTAAQCDRAVEMEEIARQPRRPRNSWSRPARPRSATTTTAVPGLIPRSGRSAPRWQSSGSSARSDRSLRRSSRAPSRPEPLACRLRSPGSTLGAAHVGLPSHCIPSIPRAPDGQNCGGGAVPSRPPVPSMSHMELIGAVVSDYKSVRHAEVPLGGLTVLCGPNGAGKTNLIEAIGAHDRSRG